MKKNFVRVAAAVLMLAAMPVMTACSALKPLDVIGRRSIVSFDAVLQTASATVTRDTENNAWVLAASDGSARYLWGAAGGTALPYDVMLAVDAEPLIGAGLDPSRLPDAYVLHRGEILIGTKLGSDTMADDDGQTALSAYERIVDKHREAIGYHASLDHFGVMLGGGNMFEWAKDMKGNGVDGSNQDKDIVFVLNPEPLIEAGLDPENVEGWAYAQVLVDEDGKMVQAWKLLKPFDLQ